MIAVLYDVDSELRAVTVFAWFMLFLVLRRIGILVFSGLKGDRSQPNDRPPEDTKIMPEEAGAALSRGQETWTAQKRAGRTMDNDTENDILFVPLLLALAFSPIPATTRRIICYAAVYAFSRFVYAVSYLGGFQPWRSVMFSLTLLTTLVLALDLSIASAIAE
eukprot:TRINITY_DN3852_c0_g3_i4.p1 TRINITY_DN3852_c0_g3~~TRINITY_DN3852_c0_g3_i4.p1  ORF type:complete len:163 (+),score=50.84 TRINITY_DN3852_c0_g3_i4:75-563(+)